MGWYEATKDVISIAQKADNVDLLGKILDMQKEMQDIQQENYELKKLNDELHSIINRDRNMEYNDKRNALYENIDEQKYGPYCTHCWEVDKKAITLIKEKNSHYKCPHCKNEIRLYLPTNEEELLK